MELIFKGKTKDVYKLDDGNYMLKMKDDVTVGEDGKFDPGANTTGLKIDGLRFASLKMTAYYFDLLNKKGLPTHFISADTDNATMTVKPAEFFGGGPALEVICRFRAVGSFYRRYQNYCKEEGMALNALVEMTLKDDERGDPFITKETLAELNILPPDEYEILKSLTKKIAHILKDDLTAKGLELYDMKLEFGKINGEITLVDEISGGSVRVYKDGRWLQPPELAGYF
jgi:phosphoribosylaminoimidazole-succinocarboxamide synthase